MAFPVLCSAAGKLRTTMESWNVGSQASLDANAAVTVQIKTQRIFDAIRTKSRDPNLSKNLPVGAVDRSGPILITFVEPSG